MRPIDADRLKEDMGASCLPIMEEGISGITGDCSTIVDHINAAPTIDAEPARWIPHKPGYVYACSNCGFGTLITAQFRNGRCIKTHTDNRTPYCPSCGKRMDGDTDDGS